MGRGRRKGEFRTTVLSLRGSVLEMTIVRTKKPREAMMESPSCIPITNGYVPPLIFPPAQNSQWDTGIPHSGLILSESNEVALCHIPLESIRKSSRSHLLKMFPE